MATNAESGDKQMRTGIKSIEPSDLEEVRDEVEQLAWIENEFRKFCPNTRIDTPNTLSHPMKIWEWARVLLNIKEHFGEPLQGLSILDIGSAVSLLGPALSYLGCDVQEVEVDDNFKKDRLDLKLILDQSPHGGSFDWKQMGFGRLHEFGEKQFDVVMSISTIEHVEPSLEKAAWKEMYDRVKPGGLLIVTMDCFEVSKKGYIYDDVRWTNFDMNMVKERVDELKSYGLIPSGEEDYSWHGVHVADGSFACIHMERREIATGSASTETGTTHKHRKKKNRK